MPRILYKPPEKCARRVRAIGGMLARKRGFERRLFGKHSFSTAWDKIIKIYNELYSNGIKVYDYDIGFDKAVALEVDGSYAIFVDNAQIQTSAEERHIILHESGHAMTGEHTKFIVLLKLLNKTKKEQAVGHIAAGCPKRNRLLQKGGSIMALAYLTKEPEKTVQETEQSARTAIFTPDKKSYSEVSPDDVRLHYQTVKPRLGTSTGVIQCLTFPYSVYGVTDDFRKRHINPSQDITMFDRPDKPPVSTNTVLAVNETEVKDHVEQARANRGTPYPKMVDVNLPCSVYHRQGATAPASPVPYIAPKEQLVTIGVRSLWINHIDATRAAGPTAFAAMNAQIAARHNAEKESETALEKKARKDAAIMAFTTDQYDKFKRPHDLQKYKDNISSLASAFDTVKRRVLLVWNTIINLTADYVDDVVLNSFDSASLLNAYEAVWRSIAESQNEEQFNIVMAEIDINDSIEEIETKFTEKGLYFDGQVIQHLLLMKQDIDDCCKAVRDVKTKLDQLGFADHKDLAFSLDPDEDIFTAIMFYVDDH